MDLPAQSLRKGSPKPAICVCVLQNITQLVIQHVASNKYTRYRPYPTPTQLAASQDLISRMTVFLRRELLVWPNADVEVCLPICLPRVYTLIVTFNRQFLVTFVISLMKSIDIRSESAIKLLAEFLDMDTPYVPGERHVNAEHFAHGSFIPDPPSLAFLYSSVGVVEIYCYLRSPYRDLSVYDSVVQVRQPPAVLCTWADCRLDSKYDAPPGIPPPPSYERTRRWEPPGQSPSRSQSPNLRQSHSRSRPPPSTGEWNTRPEGSPQSSDVSREQDLGSSSISPHSPAEISRVGVSCRRYGEDDRPAARHCSRSPTRVKDKGKQRAPAPLLSPAPEFDILRSSPATRHERTGPPEISTTPTSLSLSQNTPEGSAAVSADVDVNPRVANPPVFQTSENISAGTPVVSPQPLNGNPCTAAQTTHSDCSPLGLEGPHSLNYGIITSLSSKSETPEPLPINLNYAPTNPVRQPRYRSQRDTIMAHLRTPSTMLRPSSSAQPNHASSLLARMTDEAVAKPNVSGADSDVIERSSGGGRARLIPPRAAAAAKRSSSPFVNDDPCGGEGTTAVTEAGTSHLFAHCSLAALATRALTCCMHCIQ